MKHKDNSHISKSQVLPLRLIEGSYCEVETTRGHAFCMVLQVGPLKGPEASFFSIVKVSVTAPGSDWNEFSSGRSQICLDREFLTNTMQFSWKFSTQGNQVHKGESVKWLSSDSIVYSHNACRWLIKKSFTLIPKSIWQYQTNLNFWLNSLESDIFKFF